MTLVKKEAMGVMVVESFEPQLPIITILYVDPTGRPLKPFMLAGAEAVVISDK